ncbi:MAG: ParB/RepB/Spo0J family partition protein [Myxococcaceae bacterium]|jgi:ParB family chromosome partitioning protein|nr:ParB/RepB/Spo0J family partition protein [Myxococcaceae bacterium]
MAATKKKPRAPRRKKADAGSKGLAPKDVGTGADASKALEANIVADGGVVIGSYRDPLGGHGVVLAALPIEKVKATDYQRDRSETHVKKLANAMERVGRYLDPVIALRHDDGFYHSPNGNHRLGAMGLLGAKSIVALVVPDAEVEFKILALNTEKAHNLKERSLEVIRMYRGLVGARGKELETSFLAEFEEPHFATFGIVYEQRPRFSAGAYSSVVKRLEGFFEEPLEAALKEREKRARLLMAWDDEVVKVVDALKAKGLQSPYLKNYVVARVNFLRFKKGGEFDFEETIAKLHAATAKIDPTKVNKDDVAKMGGGAPAESDE